MNKKDAPVVLPVVADSPLGKAYGHITESSTAVHICAAPMACICSRSAASPEDNCPQHGSTYVARCVFCGRYMTRSADGGHFA